MSRAFERYHRVFSLEYYAEVLAILHELERVSNVHSVLDIGCGWGFTQYILRTRGYYVAGMDIDCSDTIIPCVKHDATKFPYPFKNKVYDAVISQHFIEHFNKDMQYKIIREMGRIADKVVIVVTPNRNYRWKYPDGTYYPDHKRVLTKEELRDLLSTITNDNLVKVYEINNFVYVSNRYHPVLSWIVSRVARLLRGYPTLIGVAFYPE